jgi:hypothetical protein
MLVSQKLATAAHLHVLLRRKTGRVTDTEWLAANLEYALEIIRFARAKASEDGHPDLAEWADKLEAAMLTPSPAQPRPLVQAAAQLLAPARPVPVPAATAPSPVVAAQPATEAVLPMVPRYIGGIR